MKKLLMIGVLISCNWMAGFSQTDSNFVIARNADITRYTSDGIKIVASDVYSKLGKVKRRIQIYDAHNLAIGEAYITLESLNAKENIYNKIKTNPAGFSGTLAIEIDGRPVYTRTIVNGVAKKGLVSGKQAGGGIGGVGGIGGGPGPVYNPNVPCTVKTVHDCVAYNIESMNWVQYALCLIAASGCYIGEWLSCHWEVCHNHMQYTNPN